MLENKLMGVSYTTQQNNSLNSATDWSEEKESSGSYSSKEGASSTNQPQKEPTPRTGWILSSSPRARGFKANSWVRSEE
jgi:hypothetical protein